MLPENYLLAKFGIDEIYFHKNLDYSLLEKLHQRAADSFDGDHHIVQKHVSHDMILIFYKQVATASIIYRFLKLLDQDPNKESFIENNTLLNEEELFAALKSKQFILVTKRILHKNIATP
jgi:hypothetical protein